MDDQRFIPGLNTLAGIGGLLFSPGRSLFLYAPLTLVGLFGGKALWKRDRTLAAMLASISGALLILYGSLFYWDGLRGYGPRYLVPLVPL